jgi:geranylgeranyl reductase family protein
MKKYSVIIIGAGPGGLCCATLLARHGLDVLVIERKKTIGPKPCGGGITWRGLIQRVPEKLITRSFVAQHVQTNFQNFVISSPTPMVATVNRRHLGQWMAQQARDQGARLLTGASVKKIHANSVTLTDDNGREQRYGYRYLVGADGSSSMLRKYLRLDTTHMGLGIQYLVPGHFANMEWHLNTRLLGNGYCWIFPSQEFASIGIYTDGRQLSTGEMLKRLQQWATGQGINLHGLKPQAGRINYDYQGWRFGNKILVGDAAGLASGLTGEGIYPAIVSGEAAAYSILNPEYRAVNLLQLIRKQQIHRQILAISGKNPFVCSLVMELLAIGLRASLIAFSKLEMAD